MINRVLIRMKTVQLLYSYLLVDKSFSLEPLPSEPTKEKRFAHSLYLNLIYLIDRLAYLVKGKNKTLPLTQTRFVERTQDDDQLKPLKIKYKEGNFIFSPVELELAEKIKESLLFKNFEKTREEGKSEDDFWEKIFNNIIITDPSLNNLIREIPDYSLSGMDRLKELMEVTFRNFYTSKDNIKDALNVLETSMHKARDLYMRLLALTTELTRLRADQLELNRRKIFATNEDLNPNLKFVENQVSALIEANPVFDEYTEKNHLSWIAEDRELLEILLKEILKSEIYQNYISDKETGIKVDSKFWEDVFLNIILENKDFLEYLENKSVFWNDDLEIMTSFVIKTFKRLENSDTRESAVMPMYKDGEDGKDARFGAELFNYVYRNKALYRHYIEEALAHEKWETERLAFMDVVITMTALAEILNYPEIPLTVSINEYIEIAKSYSSAKSGQFVHGLLGSIIDMLKEKNILMK